MADTKISALPLATSVDGTEVAPIVQTGENKRTTMAAVKAYVVADASLLKTSDIGTTVQAYSANTVLDASYVHTDNNYTTTEKSKLSGIADGAEVNVNADWNAISGDAQILNKPTLGTAAYAATTDFATAAQGTKADTALQPAAIGVTVQGYDADLSSWAAIAPGTKQDTLVSGTNIKTINGSTLLGSGDLVIASGGTPGGLDTQVQFNNGGAFGADAGLAFNKTTGKLTVGGKTVNTSAPVLDLSQTWNAPGITFTGINFNVTDTASAAGSLLMDLQVGGVSKFKVDKNGALSFFGSGAFLETNLLRSLRISMDQGTTYSVFIGNGYAGTYFNGIQIGNGAAFGWSSAPFPDVGGVGWDLTLFRDAANTLAQRNGTNAQTKRLYGTYTDASNYRRLTQTMSAGGVAEIKPEGAGTGVSGNVLHISGLPTSNPGPGILWNNAGVVNVGT